MWVCVCVCVCVCVRCSTFETPITHKRLEISIWNLIRQWSNHNPSIVTIFMTIDARFVILRDFEFKKKGRGSSNFRKIRAIVLKLHTNILHPSRNFGIDFGQNRFKRSNFFRFSIFWEFFQNCLTQANFDLSSWNFVGTCTNTEWCLIPNFIRIGGDLLILDEFFFFFFSWHQIIKIRCIHEALSVRKPKSSNVLPQRKNFVKSVRKQYGNPDSHPFLTWINWKWNIT